MEARAKSANLQKLGEFEPQTKTKKGCECGVWKNFKGYTEPHNRCGKDKGNGPWCLVVDEQWRGQNTVFARRLPRPMRRNPREPWAMPQDRNPSVHSQLHFAQATLDQSRRLRHRNQSNASKAVCRGRFAYATMDSLAKLAITVRLALKSIPSAFLQVRLPGWVVQRGYEKCECPSNLAGDKCEICASGFSGPKCFPMSTIPGRCAGHGQRARSAPLLADGFRRCGFHSVCVDSLEPIL